MSLEHPASLLTSVLASVALFGTVAACGSSSAKTLCKTNDQCDSSSACTKGVCLHRVNGRTLAVDVQPLGDSMSAHTEFASVTVGADPLDLSAIDKVLASGAVIDLEGFYSRKAHLVAVTPSLIPGQADLRLETDLARYAFMLSFARNLLKANATVWLFPGDQVPSRPPIPIATMLDVTMGLTFPRSNQLIIVRGVLHNSLDEPAPGFVTRAYAGNNAISNAVMTDGTGMFQLLLSKDAVPPEAGGMISIHADHADAPVGVGPAALDPVPADPVPRFETQLLRIATTPGNINQLRTFRMPAFAKAAPLRFTVQAADAPMKPVPDVAVRFRTEISALPDGRAIYETMQTTDANGEVEVQLIPGTANAPRNYEISLAPALDSTFGALCVPVLPITMVGSEAVPQYSATLPLHSRVVLVGTVVDQAAMPAASVTVTATPAPGSTNCVNPPSTTPVSATTLRDGKYRMLLDSGVYRLDFDPPMGAPLPRLTLDSVTLDADSTQDIVLPTGEVVKGTLRASDGNALASAGIKFFQVLCQGDSCQGPSRIPPGLRAQTRTDADGNFTAVLPVQPPP